VRGRETKAETPSAKRKRRGDPVGVLLWGVVVLSLFGVAALYGLMYLESMP
jgi:hypothetical protein